MGLSQVKQVDKQGRKVVKINKKMKYKSSLKALHEIFIGRSDTHKVAHCTVLYSLNTLCPPPTTRSPTMAAPFAITAIPQSRTVFYPHDRTYQLEVCAIVFCYQDHDIQCPAGFDTNQTMALCFKCSVNSNLGLSTMANIFSTHENLKLFSIVGVTTIEKLKCFNYFKIPITFSYCM